MHPLKNKIPIIQALALSIASVFVFFLWQGNIGFSLWDEGYLWYGVQRVLEEEVPKLDFKSYDPGRYYWAAFFMNVWEDNGIMSLRYSVTIFQTIGLFFGLLLIAHSSNKQNFTYLFLSAIILMIWMYPRHKLFDITISIILIGALSILINRVTSKNFFILGICVGVAAFFGRNHGLYGLFACFGLFIWLIFNNNSFNIEQGFLFWIAGILVGYSPIVFMMIFIPDFAHSFWESIIWQFEFKATNIPIAIPWPWLVDFSSTSTIKIIHELIIGMFFIAVFSFSLITISIFFFKKLNNKQVDAVVIASAFLALPYMHVAYVRSDIAHLSQSIFPLLIGSIVLISIQKNIVKWPLIIILCISSYIAMFTLHPGWSCFETSKCTNVEISGDEILMDSNTAADISFIRELVNKYAHENEKNFLVMPFWPGVYPLFEKKSPVWDIYALHPRSKIFEQQEIDRIKQAMPTFVLIIDIPLDGRDELRFRNTHPLTYNYITSNFQLDNSSSKGSHQVYINNTINKL